MGFTAPLNPTKLPTKKCAFRPWRRLDLAEIHHDPIVE